jgi:hypothetical protein
MGTKVRGFCWLVSGSDWPRRMIGGGAGFCLESAIYDQVNALVDPYDGFTDQCGRASLDRPKFLPWR